MCVRASNVRAVGPQFLVCCVAVSSHRLHAFLRFCVAIPNDPERLLVLVGVVHGSTDAWSKQGLEDQPVDNVADLEGDPAHVER